MTPRNSITLRFLAEPTDVNFGGKVHGGSVMKWIDQAGYACAVNWSRNYCVTVYVGGIRFWKPVFIGDLVEVNAHVIYTGKTSIHVAVDIYSQKPGAEAKVKNTHCIIVFVAVDANGSPIPVPEWVPVTEDDRQLEAYAKKLVDLRKSIEDEMQRFTEL